MEAASIFFRGRDCDCGGGLGQLEARMCGRTSGTSKAVDAVFYFWSSNSSNDHKWGT